MADTPKALTPAQILAWREWVWPVPIWKGRKPYVTDTFFPEEQIEDKTRDIDYHRKHLGVDVMYPKRFLGDPPFPRSSKNSTVPVGVPALAAYKGKIWNAKKGTRGHYVTIDHGNVPNIGPVLTFYQHLASFDRPWKKGDIVETGDVLGPVGGDLPPNYQLVHLHFELQFPKADTPPESWRVNPLHYMPFWGFVRMGSSFNPLLVASLLGAAIVGGVVLHNQHQARERIAFKKQLKALKESEE